MKGYNAPSGEFWCYLTHWRASQVFPVSEDFFCDKNTRVLIKSGHKTAASIGKYDDGVLLPLFLSWPTCDDFWLSGGGLPFALEPRLLGGYVILYYIYFEGRERNICRDCIDELVCVCVCVGGGGASQINWRIWERALCPRQFN